MNKNCKFNLTVPKEELDLRAEHANFYRLICAYRDLGHKQADVDPIAVKKPKALSELKPENFGVRCKDNVRLRGLLQVEKSESDIAEAVDILRKMYCGTISAEFNYLEVSIICIIKNPKFSNFEHEYFFLDLDRGRKRVVCEKFRKEF